MAEVKQRIDAVELAEAVLRYGQHLGTCDMSLWRRGARQEFCNCAFTEVKAAAQAIVNARQQDAAAYGETVIDHTLPARLRASVPPGQALDALTEQAAAALDTALQVGSRVVALYRSCDSLSAEHGLSAEDRLIYADIAGQLAEIMGPLGALNLIPGEVPAPAVPDLDARAEELIEQCRLNAFAMGWLVRSLLAKVDRLTQAKGAAEEPPNG